MNKLLYLSMLISLPISVYSQQLRGKVLNDQNQPIENALITARLLNGDLFRYAATTRDGDFSISKLENGIYEVVIKSVGYAAFTDTVNISGDTNTGDIMLVQKTIELEGVTIVSEIPAIKNTGTGVVVNVDNSYLI